MTRLSSVFGLRVTTGHLLWVAAVTPAVLQFVTPGWLAIVLAVLLCGATLLTVRGRRATGWFAAVLSWWRRRRVAPTVPSQPSVATTVMPGDPVAVRWQGDHLVSIVELIPRPFTPTVIVSGEAFTDDVVDTRLVERLISTFSPDLEADVVSAGYRTGRAAPASLVALYDQVVGPNPAPAHRRTWILLRARPSDTWGSAQRRGTGVEGLARYLVASTARIADQLASNGIDARCADSFDDYDQATAISFEREAWTSIEGRGTFTTAYTAAGGPNVWWSARADHTITRVRIRAGDPPRSTVLLTTLATPSTPPGFSCLYGGQRFAVDGKAPTTDRHHLLPIGSAGVLIGETVDRYPVYMPFDDVDASINLGDARLFTQFVMRSAAAGAVVTLGPRFHEFAGVINARIGTEDTIAWPAATTYLGPHPDIGRVVLRHNFIDTPRHRQLPIRLVNPREESRYQTALGQ